MVRLGVDISPLKLTRAGTARYLTNILDGLAYINFHTVQFRGGEIRGQILAPEPATLVLLGIGAAGLMGRRRRRT